MLKVTEQVTALEPRFPCSQASALPKDPGRREIVGADIHRAVRQEKNRNRLKTEGGAGRGRMEQRRLMWEGGHRQAESERKTPTEMGHQAKEAGDR